MKNLITVAEYPPSQIPERYIVELEHGKCRLQKECRSCKSFHKIPELRGKNMTINEKLYARMYTKTFLRKVHALYYQLPNEELSRIISNCFSLN